ncbi:putative ABC transport system permease protein [Kibdelosporangium banguiense]|uniref:ABC transport system permease protein n=1 Tax=Kibdelosporangium banguiense TaxID=1365924 RepID=A0ABS4T5P1_9PSEU|nr:ABC transporter permease [Kibdelosporangium banguiense]MBP2319788.1 putative ABC transport system permease protein [Kibdelosporangium banguiense]
MLRAMLRDLRAHKGRIAMTLVAIVLGVGFVVATWVVSDSTAKSLAGADLRDDVGVSVQIADRGPELTPADLDRLGRIPGVANASGVVFGHAGLIGSDGKLISSRPDQAGTGWDSSARFDLVDGRAPVPGEVALGEQQARQAGRQVGDKTRVLLADGRSLEATVAGEFVYRPFDEPSPGVAFGDPGVLGDRFTRVELTAKPGANVDAIASAARGLVDPALRKVATGPQLVAEAQTRADASAQSVRESLLGFVAVALLAGIFVIANTFSMLVTQRTRQLALLRAVGASRRQVRRAVLIEAGVLGLIGATLGIALGIGICLLGLWLMRPEGQPTSFSVSPTSILVGYAVGVVVTMVAAYSSARRAAAVSPMAALRTDASFERRSLVTRTVLGLTLLAGGVLAVVLTLANNLSTTERLVAMGGGIVAWIGVLLLAPVLADLVLRPAGRLLSRWGGAAMRLGVRNSIRDSRRTAATTSALMVGLALVCAFATLGESTVSMLSSAIRGIIPASATVVESPTSGTPLGTDVLDKVRALPGVGNASADRYGSVKVTHNGSTSSTSLSAIEPDGVIKPEVISGTADVRQGAVVGENEAAMIGVGIGDQVTLQLDPVSSVTTTVVGLHRGTEGRPLFYIDVAAIPAKYRDTRVTTVYATGPDASAVRSSIEAAFADRPDVIVTDREGVIESATTSFQLILTLMYALFGAAIVIAAFGVVNTLALSVMERTREIGVLRAVGAGRPLIRRAIRLESVVICTYGGLLGILVGIAFGAVMQHAMFGQSLWEISVPYPVIATALIGMLIVGVLAALWPARRASRINILTAIATS